MRNAGQSELLPDFVGPMPALGCTAGEMRTPQKEAHNEKIGAARPSEMPAQSSDGSDTSKWAVPRKWLLC
jgi:hypothetical protein